MKLLTLGDDYIQIVVYVIGLVVVWAIFYYTIKAAVKNGMIEAKGHSDPTTFTANNPERPLTDAQERLKQRYDKGEIRFEEYQSEWAKLEGK